VRLKARNKKRHYETKLGEEMQKLQLLRSPLFFRKSFRLVYSDTSLGLMDADMVLLGM
jgi:hypothetical protein